MYLVESIVAIIPSPLALANRKPAFSEGSGQGFHTARARLIQSLKSAKMPGAICTATTLLRGKSQQGGEVRSHATTAYHGSTPRAERCWIARPDPKSGPVRSWNDRRGRITPRGRLYTRSRTDRFLFSRLHRRPPNIVRLQGLTPNSGPIAPQGGGEKEVCNDHLVSANYMKARRS